MSNTTANVVDVPETETPVEEAPVKEKKKRNAGYRVFAFLFAAMAIASLFLPFAFVLVGNEVTKTSFLLRFFENRLTYCTLQNQYLLVSFARVLRALKP